MAGKRRGTEGGACRRTARPAPRSARPPPARPTTPTGAAPPPLCREAPPRRRGRGAACRPGRPRMRRGARGPLLPAAISLSPACSARSSAPPAAPAFPPASPPLRPRRHSAEKVRAGRWEEGGFVARGCGSAGGGGRGGGGLGLSLSRASAPLPWSRAPSGPLPGWGCFCWGSEWDEGSLRIRLAPLPAAGPAAA